MIGTYVNNTRSNGHPGKDYVRVTAGKQRYQYVHRMIAAAMMGRELRSDEVADHVDGDGLNNHPSNLRVVLHEGNSRKQNIRPEDIIFDGQLWW